ncbi:MAG: hypothetical protein HFJ84_02700 [Clostridiales bacterium]|jgi:hypothetical protein|nr:hypothetical protein [Clostridiales bacterium]
MKRFDWRIILISVAIFIIPPLAIPTRGVLTEGITTYVYGFPFSWFSIFFESRGGKAFLVQALSEPHSGISVSIVSAIMNLLIIYIVVNAVVKVFVFKKRNHPEDQPPMDDSVSSDLKEEKETATAQSRGSDEQ